MPTFRQLEINLTSGETQISDVTPLFQEFLGGTGVAAALLRDHCPPEVDPYAPAAPVFFVLGPFSSVLPVCTKTVAAFKSPLTRNLGESHAGGRLALAMYGAGFHVLKIVGRSEFPCYLTIEGETVTIHRAHSLWGMSAQATERVLRDHVVSDGKRSIVRIGPAGERQSPIAAVTVDAARHFGRMGLGGVLGSKNLKAFVISGSSYWPVANRGLYSKVYQKIYDLVVKSSTMKKYHDLGTSMNVVPLSRLNGLPTRNFSQGFFEGAASISGEQFADRHLSQQIACAHCQVGCIHMATLRECFNPAEHMFKTNRVSYDHELIYALGSNLSLSSTDEIMRLILRVEKQGWDAMSIGVTLAWAIDAFQAGYLTTSHTDGLALNFGDGECCDRVLQRIAAGHNEFYSDLEKGTAFCTEKYGGKEFGMVFGRNEAPGYMTGLQAFLGYASGVRHSHLDSGGYSFDQKHLTDPADDDTWTDRLYDEAVTRMTLTSLVICLFARKVYSNEIILEGLTALGIEGWSEARLHETARRVHLMKNDFKVACGFSWEGLEFPSRLERVQCATGRISEERYRKALSRYRQRLGEDRLAMETRQT